MAKRKHQGIDEADLQDEYYEQLSKLQNVGAPEEDPLVVAVNRVVNAMDINLDDMQKGVDECLMLGIDKLREMITQTPDDAVRLKAINTSVAIANHVTKRRELALNEGGSITVNINGQHVPPSLQSKGQMRIGDGDQ